MQVVLTDKLRDYLAQKPERAVLISTYQSHGCTGSPEVVINLIDDAKADELRAKDIACFSTDILDVFITQSWIPEEEDATVELDLQGFFGTKTIIARGLQRPKLYW